MKLRVWLPLAVLLAWVGFSVTVVPAYAQTDAAAIPVKPAGPEIDGDYSGWTPPDISEHGHAIDSLINYVHLFMAVIFVGWAIFFVYCLVKFRQRRGHRANPEQIKAKPAKYSEIIVAGVEAVLLLSLSAPIWASVKNDIPEPKDNPVRVKVVAEQFQWNFHYPGKDGIFGRSAPRHINPATNVLGLDPDDPNGEDDVYSPELHFPVERPVICDLSSKDVIHSFGIPVMRVKQDIIPGMTIPVWFKATTTGNYEIACAQLCGNNHYSMRALMTIHESDAVFQAWLAKQAEVEEFDEDEFD